MNTNNINKIEIDNSKLEAIKLRTIYEEKLNLKTKEKSKDGMIELLKNIIVEEVNKKY